MNVTLTIKLVSSNPLGAGYRVSNSLDSLYVDFLSHKEARAFVMGFGSAMRKVSSDHKITTIGYICPRSTK